MSRPVITDVSDRPVAVDVRARNKSRRLFCSARRTPWEFWGGGELVEWRGSGEQDGGNLEVEDFLKVGEGLTGDQEEVVLDELLGWFLGGHDDLEQRVDFKHALGYVARVAAIETRVSWQNGRGWKGLTSWGRARSRPAREGGGGGTS